MRRASTAGLALLLALAAAACGSGAGDHPKGAGPSQSPSGAVSGSSSAAGSGTAAGSAATTRQVRSAVTVSGAVGSKPKIKIDTPLHLAKSTSWTLSSGHGPKVGQGQQYVVDLTFADGRTGRVVASTYDQGHPVVFSPSQGFPVINAAVAGKAVGSRLVVAAAAQDAYGDKGSPQLGIKPGDPVVMVVDLTGAQPTDVLTGPSGKSVKPPASAPKLQVSKGTPTGFDFSGTTKPKRLRVVTLVKGSGPVVKAGDLITVNYLGAVWGKDKAFDESYSRQPATFAIGLSQVIPAWDRGLVGVTRGSRVLLLCPPDVAYGAQGSGGTIPPNATLAFVVDVLGVG